MLLNIDSSVDTPLYKQICNEIISGIFLGKLKLGEELPSVRQLGKDLGINYHTVRKSYKELEEKGYISIEGRTGAVINTSFNQDEYYRKKMIEDFTISVREGLLHGMTLEELIEMIKNENNKFIIER